MSTRRKLLMVEDDLDLLHLLELRAKYRGFQCRTDTTGASCLEKVKKMKPDLILMDLNLPKLNGIELILQIKQRSDLATIPIIIYSSFSETELVKDALHLGANTYFVKNGDMNDLFDIIEAYTSSGHAASDL